jgi:hypothetical protein
MLCTLPSSQGTCRLYTLPSSQVTCRLCTLPSSQGTFRLCTLPSSQGTCRLCTLPSSQGTCRLCTLPSRAAVPSDCDTKQANCMEQRVYGVTSHRYEFFHGPSSETLETCTCALLNVTGHVLRQYRIKAKDCAARYLIIC